MIINMDDRFVRGYVRLLLSSVLSALPPWSALFLAPSLLPGLPGKSTSGTLRGVGRTRTWLAGARRHISLGGPASAASGVSVHEDLLQAAGRFCASVTKRPSISILVKGLAQRRQGQKQTCATSVQLEEAARRPHAAAMDIRARQYLSIVRLYRGDGPPSRLVGVGSDGRSLESREEPTACMDGIVQLSGSLLAPGGFIGPQVQLKISELLGVIAPPSAGPKQPWMVGAREEKKNAMSSGQFNDSISSSVPCPHLHFVGAGRSFQLQSFPGSAGSACQASFHLATEGPKAGPGLGCPVLPRPAPALCLARVQPSVVINGSLFLVPASTHPSASTRDQIDETSPRNYNPHSEPRRQTYGPP